MYIECEESDFEDVISNENYVIAMNQKGQGVSKYKDYYVNRFKPTDDYAQGIFFSIKMCVLFFQFSKFTFHVQKQLQR